MLREISFIQKNQEIEELFIIAKIWKQPKGPSKDEWIKQLWYISTTEYYSARGRGWGRGRRKRRKKIEGGGEENITLCNSIDVPGEHYAKGNKPVKDNYQMISLICEI